MLQALSAPIPIHPLAIVGLTGVVINALNMMPIGRLDGGRAASAVFGRRTAAVLGTLTLLLQVSCAAVCVYASMQLRNVVYTAHFICCTEPAAVLLNSYNVHQAYTICTYCMTHPLS
jgi:membrane-associated protease RseP (regulator of RpoE activity)